ncbi:MAG: 50S ribosome-binding GTPase, partial [Gammaproteobacteria bacterium]|nr:50S ribosome-binding GTPase [Gammaproteobacteria bacterium]
MKLDRVIRTVIALAIVVVFVIGIGAILFVTESALNVWDRLVEGPRLLLYGYVGAMAALAVLTVWLIWRLLIRRKISPSRSTTVAKLTKGEIEQRLREAEAVGIDTSEAQAELKELASRQQAGAVHLCFFGEISTGKSSLIKALAPDADVSVDVVGGSTTDTRHYRWQADDGTEILLTDVPGTGGHEAGLDELALEEAQRSHVVLFVCDGDLTRAEKSVVQRLLSIEKPLV